MNQLIPRPFSGGIFLTYKCIHECKHCMYACSPKWKEDWISINDAGKILTQVFRKKSSPIESNRIGVNYGVHFTGGEPFLNFPLLLKIVGIADELKIPSTFVETNCFWCVDDKSTREKLIQLKEEGLCGLLISVNPFILEWVPFSRIERGIRIAEAIFGENVIVYHPLFYNQLKGLGISETLLFDKYLERMQKLDKMGLYQALGFPSLFPMGRALYELEYLYKKHKASDFFGSSCKEELIRDWHIHIDNYGNYIPGYCAGISLGKWWEIESCGYKIDLEPHPVLKALVTEGVEGLYKLSIGFNYKECEGGYISKCHLCVDIRKHLVQKTQQFKELAPREFYYHLE